MTIAYWLSGNSIVRSKTVARMIATPKLLTMLCSIQIKMRKMTLAIAANSAKLEEQDDGGRAAAPPDSIQLTGVVRDFRVDHPDFQRQPRKANGSGSFGHYVGIPAQKLGDDGKPVFASQGRKVLSQWMNAEGQKIMPEIEDTGYMNSQGGDVAGSCEASGNAIESAESFDQWFRDVDGVNVGRALSIRLNRNEATGSYAFDDSQDDLYRDRGGFFPINGEMYGDYQSNINYHFTYELNTQFNYEAGSGQTFRFIGDDDVWVYIDGRLVIDLGGVHSKIDQVVELDRLNWLVDGDVYTLQFFFAERHTTQSNFRIETNLLLRTIKLPATTALHD